MSEHHEEERVVDLIREHYGPEKTHAEAFTGGIQRRIQRRRTQRIGVLATVFLLAGIIGLYAQQMEIPTPAPEGGVAPSVTEVAAAGEPVERTLEMEDWWSEDFYQASLDEGYPEEYQALAALVVDPLYEEDWE
jgi:hypothetical protein